MRFGMRFCLLSLLMLQVAVVLAQNGQTGSQAPTPARAEISPDTPVITMDGLCANDLVTDNVDALLNAGAEASASKNLIDPNCKTVVTRQQYEQLLISIGGKITSSSTFKFAQNYTEMLLFGEAAHQAGAEKVPAFQGKLRFNYLQALLMAAMVQMQHQADDITDADTEKYFNEHPERFVRKHVERISVPKYKGYQDPVPAKMDPVVQAEMYQVALRIQKEAAAGGNMEKLQDKAYKAAGNVSVPDIDMGDALLEEIEVDDRPVIAALEPGQVSSVIEKDHEYVILKVASKKVVPPQERKKLYGWLRMRDSKEALQDRVHTQFNLQYFPDAPQAAPGAASSGKTP